jgi:hypothetical protein
MTVIITGGYSGTYANTHARILHSGGWLTGGTVTASSTATDYFADGPDNSLTYEKWKPTALAATWEYNFGGSETFDCCAIGAHTLGTNGNSLQVQKYAAGAWTDVLTATAISDDSPIMVLLPSTTDSRARIRISGGTAPEVGVIKFGTVLEMPRPLYGGHVPLDLGRVTQMRSNTSVTGEFLGRTKQRVMQQASVQWQHITAAWMRTNWPGLQRGVEEEPFFIATRPSDTDFGAVGLCYVQDMPVPQTMGIRDLMEVSMSLTGYGYD